MNELSGNRLAQLLADLKAAHPGFTWESKLWAGVGHRRSPYRALVLFGLSARTRDSLLVEMCRAFFARFPDGKALAEGVDRLLPDPKRMVRPGQMPFVASMAEAVRDGVPGDRESLLAIKGVGEKIAECVLAYGWGREALPLDANCVRVLERVLGLEYGRRNPAPLRERLKSVYLNEPEGFFDLSVSMVDIHEILRLHGQVCCARTPDCARCPVSGCRSRREPWDGESLASAPPGTWDDWRELINEPAPV